MANQKYSIPDSTVQSNILGLIQVLKITGKSHLLKEIEPIIANDHADKLGRHPLKQTTETLVAVAKIVGEENLGLKIMNTINLENLALYKTLHHCSGILFKDGKVPTVAILIQLIARYFSVLSESVSVVPQERQDGIVLTIRPNIPSIISIHQTEGVVVGIYRLILSFYDVQPNKIFFTHENPAGSNDIYTKSFNLIPEFNSAENMMEYRVNKTEEAFSNNTITMYAAVQNLLDKEYPNVQFKDRCRHILSCILSFGEPKREHVASILNMSISSLQRRLKEEDTSFKAILLDLRKSLVHDYLIVDDRSITDVAFLLGYQSSSQFFKAFKMWFLCTPLQYQKQHLTAI